ncbi:MAG: hypothetical protein KAQ66_02425 [Rhodospirillaceae bacterium]|nr:hypothetical protein [Rhodospirillaceae bacterium]MCK5546729.1 hypothetical protein [Rhodospirillaceae bacterium]
MGSIIPMILSAVVGQMFEKNNPNNGKQNSALQAQLEEIRKREQINATDRRQKYKSLLASERARLAGSGISSNSGLAGSVLSGLLKRQKQETKDAGELSAMSESRINNKMQKPISAKGASRNLLERVINKI